MSGAFLILLAFVDLVVVIAFPTMHGLDVLLMLTLAVLDFGLVALSPSIRVFDVFGIACWFFSGGVAFAWLVQR